MKEVLKSKGSKLAAARRNDPNYAQIMGHIPKPMAKRLKFYCLEKETTISEVVEQAVKEFLEKYDVNNDQE